MEALVSLLRAMACHLPLEDLAVAMGCLRLLVDSVADMVCLSSRCRWSVARAAIHLRLVNFRLRTLRLREAVGNPLRGSLLNLQRLILQIPNRLLDLCSPTSRDWTRCHP